MMRRLPITGDGRVVLIVQRRGGNYGLVTSAPASGEYGRRLLFGSGGVGGGSPGGVVRISQRGGRTHRGSFGSVVAASPRLLRSGFLVAGGFDNGCN